MDTMDTVEITGQETDSVFVRMLKLNSKIRQLDTQLRNNPEMPFTESRDIRNELADLELEKQMLQPDFDKWVERANALYEQRNKNVLNL